MKWHTDVVWRRGSGFGWRWNRLFAGLAGRSEKIITDYVEATMMAIDHVCMYLYVQGAKDYMMLLKKLGVL